MGDIVDRPEGRPALYTSAKCDPCRLWMYKTKSATQKETNGSENKHVNVKHEMYFTRQSKLGAYRRCISHPLTPRLREICRIHFTALLQRFKDKEYQNILFTDEKIFCIQEKLNHQNDRVYARSCYEDREMMPQVTHMPHTPSVMVW